MYELLLSKSERCIEQQHDHELTVSSLWDKVKSLAAKEHFVIPDTMSDFECLLEGDKRFWFSDLKQSEDAHEDGEILDREFPDIDEIEGLGFNREQKVTLVRYVRNQEADEEEDESFAPRPFKKDEESAEGIALIAPQKSTAPRAKKPAQKKSSTKRK